MRSCRIQCTRNELDFSFNDWFTVHVLVLAERKFHACQYCCRKIVHSQLFSFSLMIIVFLIIIFPVCSKRFFLRMKTVYKVLYTGLPVHISYSYLHTILMPSNTYIVQLGCFSSTNICYFEMTAWNFKKRRCQLLLWNIAEPFFKSNLRKRTKSRIHRASELIGIKRRLIRVSNVAHFHEISMTLISILPSIIA